MQKFIQNNLYKRSFLSYLLYPLSLIYLFIVYLKRITSKPCKIGSIPVIGIGNIIAGGSGKTPFTIFLAKTLISKGKKVAIITRGYKGSLEGKNTLVNQNHTALQVGDEAIVLFKKLKNTTLIVGKDRVKSIKIINKIFPKTDFIICDDCFQNIRFKRDFNFLTFGHNIGFGNGFLLPAGILREHPKVLKFADIFVINGKNKKLEKQLRKFKKPILFGTYSIKGFFDYEGKTVSTKRFLKKKNILLSAIGNPKNFENTIKKCGIDFFSHITLYDHKKNYKKKIFKEMDYDYIFTTEKDATKMDKDWLKKMKIIVCKIEYDFKKTYVKKLLKMLIE